MHLPPFRSLLLAGTALAGLLGLATPTALGQTLQSFTLDNANSVSGRMSVAAPNLSGGQLLAGTIASSLAPGATSFNYVATRFTAAEGTPFSYVLGQSSAPADTVMIVYDGAFDPASPATNVLYGVDDFSGSRPPGVTMVGCGMGARYCPQVTAASIVPGGTITVVISTFTAGSSLGTAAAPAITLDAGAPTASSPASSVIGTPTMTLYVSGAVTHTGTPAVLRFGELVLDQGAASDILVAPAGGTIVTGSGTQTVSGVISGTGTLTVAGAGTTRLTGANTLTGPVVVANGSTLALAGAGTAGQGAAVTANGTFDITDTAAGAAVGSLSGNGNVVLGAQTLTIANGAGQAFGGAISGSGGLAMGGGTLILTGTNSYAGATDVTGGTLVVNGSIAASSGLTVASGGTLMGTGTLPSTTIQSGGTLSPGNSPGTITVNGNLALAPGAVTVIEVQGAQADRIAVAGTASLDGTLRLVPLGGSYAFNTPYGILQAASRTGRFATVSTQGAFGPGVTPTLTYLPNEVQLTLEANPLVTPQENPPADPQPAPPRPPALEHRFVPGNMRAAAAALDRANAAGADLSPLLPVYARPDADALGRAVNSLAGEVAAASPAMGALAGGQMLAAMLDPFGWGREQMLGKRLVPAEADFTSAAAPGAERGMASWGQATGAVGRIGGEGGAGTARLSQSLGGVVAGLDVAVAPGATLGFSLGAGEARASLADDLGSSRASFGQLGAHGRLRLGGTAGGLTLSGAAAFTFLETEQTRRVAALGPEPLRASPGAEVLSWRIEAVQDGLRRGGVALGPLVALQGHTAWRDGFTESGAGAPAAAALRVEAATTTQLRTELGVQAEAEGRVGGTALRGVARLAWAHYAMRDNEARAGFAALPAAGSFTVTGVRPDANALLLGIGAEARIGARWTLDARLDGEVSDRVQQVQGTARLRYAF